MISQGCGVPQCSVLALTSRWCSAYGETSPSVEGRGVLDRQTHRTLGRWPHVQGCRSRTKPHLAGTERVRQQHPALHFGELEVASRLTAGIELHESASHLSLSDSATRSLATAELTWGGVRAAYVGLETPEEFGIGATVIAVDCLSTSSARLAKKHPVHPASVSPRRQP